MVGNLLDYFEYVLSSPTGLLFAISVVLLSWHYLRMLAKKRGLPPGPTLLPLIGTMYVLPTDLTKIPFTLADLAVKYGGMCTLQSPRGNHTVVITDINHFKDAFVKSTDGAGRPFSDGKYSQKLLNPYYPVAGIVFSDYDEQLKLQRNISMVALRSLGYGKKSIENKIIEEAGHLIEAFKEKNGKAFAAKELLDNAVANIICALLFDQRYEYGDKEFIELRKCVDNAFEFIGTSALIDDLWFVKYIPSQRRKIEEFKKHVNFADNFMWRKIEERRDIMKKGEESSDFISAYLKEVDKSGGKLQNRSHQLMKDFFAAGSETTSTTMGWALYFMLKHQDVQTKIRHEIKSVIGEGVNPTLKDREKLPYTEAALTEVMRVCPTAPTSLPHKTIRDTEVGGYKLPKGTRIFGLIVPMHWNEKLFPEPHVFKPERHLDCNGQFVKNENLIPFGVGRRSCLGEQLARQELFLFFTHLIQNFEFKVPEGETLPPQRGKWFMTYRPPRYKLTANAIQ